MSKREKVGLIMLMLAQTLFLYTLITENPTGIMFIFLLVGGIFLFWLGGK
ncbi:MAG: hypothetical protein ACW99Q_13730 [Candidatus Kariarchaeaceae archaeon]